MDAILNHFYHTLFWPMVLIFGGAWLLLRLLRWLAFRVLPVWLVGPNGLFIDTSGKRMGMFDRNWDQGVHSGNPWNHGTGPNDSDNRCD